METKTAFDLNTAIQRWREHLSQSPQFRPENLEEFLPWTWSEEKKAAWRTQEQAP